MLMDISNVRDKNCRVKKMLYRELSRAFLQGAWRNSRITIRKRRENPQQRGATRKGKAVSIQWEEAREREKDIRSHEVSSYNRLGSLTYASLLCMPSPPPSYLDLLLLYSVPWNVLLLLLFRSRCTVAFGLCIIITVTASSSWLLVEEPPRTHPIFTRSLLSHPHFLFCRLSFSLFVLRMREMKKREKERERQKEEQKGD